MVIQVAHPPQHLAWLGEPLCNPRVRGCRLDTDSALTPPLPPSHSKSCQHRLSISTAPSLFSLLPPKQPPQSLTGPLGSARVPSSTFHTVETLQWLPMATILKGRPTWTQLPRPSFPLKFVSHLPPLHNGPASITALSFFFALCF